MPFMEQQITKRMAWWEIETTHGIEWVPKEDATLEQLPAYCEGKILEVTERIGYGARLSAPGYLDCTEWTVFSSVKTAQEYLDEYYPNDEEDTEND